MIIKNASVYTEDAGFACKDIYINNDKFVDSASALSDDSVIDGTGCYAIPGLTDIHFHGCVGHDFCDGTIEAIDEMAKYELSLGVTNIVPATMTLAEDELIKIFTTAGEYKKKGLIPGRARLHGINMEGPFVSPSKKGAQKADNIRRADVDLYDRLNAACGNMIKLVDLAPEEDGAMEFIDAKKDEVVISLAHTSADYDTAKEAFDRGASHVTHLYNAMNPYTHRAPGLIGAAADTDNVEVELICDGVHIHPAAVRTTFKMFGDDRIIFISDSMMGTGLRDGYYKLGGQDVKVTGNKATLKDGTIAGSATNLFDCMKTAILEMDIPLESAVKCAAVNPAKSVGIYDEYGSITPGKYADVVLIDKNSFKIVNVIIGGKAMS